MLEERRCIIYDKRGGIEGIQRSCVCVFGFILLTGLAAMNVSESPTQNLHTAVFIWASKLQWSSTRHLQFGCVVVH